MVNKSPDKRSNTAAKTAHKFSLLGKALQYCGFFHLLKLCCDFPFHICYSFDVLPPKCRDQRCQTVAVWRGDISLCILVEPILQIPGGFQSERSCVRTLSWTSQWASVLLPVVVGAGGSDSWGLVRMRQHTVYFALAPLQPALVEETAVNTQQQLCARDLVLFFLTPAIA